MPKPSKLAKKPLQNVTSNKPSKKPKQSVDTASSKNGSPADKPSKNPKAKKPKPVYKPQDREVLYQTPSAQVYRKESGKPLTAEIAKKLLGWREESENIKFGGEGEPPVHLKDHHGTKIHCINNTTNRFLVPSNIAFLKQEILRGRWRLNGEPTIIGKTGLVLDNQHTLIALVLAVQEWKEKQGQFLDTWPDEPTLNKVVVYGIEEDDATVNTINTGKPRTLADVLYRSEYFAKLAVGERRACARMAGFAIQLLWDRTGAKEGSGATKRTHAESLDFLERHPRLLNCVRHIYEENGKDNRLNHFCTPGYASGLMYLMAASATEREKDDKSGYTDVHNPSEEQIDFALWDKAEEFWVLLASGHASLHPIRAAISEMINESGNANFAERAGTLIKAWHLWHKGKKVTEEAIVLEYTKDPDDGSLKLTETPTLDGIDLGNFE